MENSFFINCIQDGLFWGCSQMEEQKDPPLSIKSVTHILQWWNFAHSCLIYRKPKKYMSHTTHPLSPAAISIFLYWFGPPSWIELNINYNQYNKKAYYFKIVLKYAVITKNQITIWL